MGVLFNQSDHTYCRIPAWAGRADKVSRAGKVSRKMKNLSSEWILIESIFQKLIEALGPVDVDLFASRLGHQNLRYISWRPDPHAWMVDAFQINWTH